MTDVLDLGDFRSDLINSLTISAGPISVVDKARATAIVNGLEAVVEERARQGAKKIVIPALIAMSSVTLAAVVLAIRAKSG